MVVLLRLLHVPGPGIKNQQVDVCLHKRGIELKRSLGFRDGILHSPDLLELDPSVEVRRGAHVKRAKLIAIRIGDRRYDILVSLM